MRSRFIVFALASGLLSLAAGCAPGILWACKRPEVTAVSLNPCDCDKCGKDTGIPFYLPKPLLIVSKNFRNIEAPTVGLTDTAPIPTGYDDQSKYADLNARTNFNGLNGAEVSGGTPADPVSAATNSGTSMKSAPTLHSAGAPITPGKAPSDGLAPETFYTYQIVFVPDMTQKYGLKIKGGPGEIRAAMNLVNGWQFTGIGPFYMKDSSTAQDILASGISTRLGGQAAADVLNASANLAKAFPAGTKQGASVDGDDSRVQRLSETISALPRDMVPLTLVDFAEIHVYEPHLTPEGMMEWSEMVNLKFNRDYLGAKAVCKEMFPAAPNAPPKSTNGTTQGAPVGVSTDDPSVARAAVAGVFGLPLNSPALTTGTLQGGAVGASPAVPSGGVNQIQVDCGGPDGCRSWKEFNLFNFGHSKKEEARPKIQNRILTTGATLVPGSPSPVAPEITADGNPSGLHPGGGFAQGVSVAPASKTPPTIINQPVINQPSGNVPLVPSLPPMKPADKE